MRFRGLVWALGKVLNGGFVRVQDVLGCCEGRSARFGVVGVCGGEQDGTVRFCQIRDDKAFWRMK